MFNQVVLLNLKADSAGAFDRLLPLFWFIAAAVVGPFVLLTMGGRESNNLPWSFWAIVPLLLLMVICVGFLRFMRESHEAEASSISPKHR